VGTKYAGITPLDINGDGLTHYDDLDLLFPSRAQNRLN
jgi:hypothetical protein